MPSDRVTIVAQAYASDKVKHVALVGLIDDPFGTNESEGKGGLLGIRGQLVHDPFSHAVFMKCPGQATTTDLTLEVRLIILSLVINYILVHHHRRHHHHHHHPPSLDM